MPAWGTDARPGPQGPPLAGSEHRGWILAFPTCAPGLMTGPQCGQIRTNWNEASPPVRQPLTRPPLHFPRLTCWFWSVLSPEGSGLWPHLCLLGLDGIITTTAFQPVSPQLPNRSYVTTYATLPPMQIRGQRFPKLKRTGGFPKGNTQTP